MAPGKLHPFQLAGASFLASRRVAYLADDMGLGKTVQAIRALDMVGATRALIICPAIVKGAWEDAFAQFAVQPRRVVDIDKPQKLDHADVALASFNAVAEHPEAFARFAPHHVVIDEAHFLKDREAGRTLAILGDVRTGLKGVASHARNTWFMSGTPAPNNASELYTPLAFAGLWKQSYWDFVNRFCVYQPTEHGISVKATKNEAELQALIKDFMFRRTEREAGIELPPLAVGSVEVEPQELVVDLDLMGQLRDAEPHAADVIDRAQRTQDFSMADAEHLATIRRLTGLLKIKSAAALARDALGKHAKIGMYAVHRGVIGELASELKAFKPLVLAGGMTDKRRRKAILDFQNPDSPHRVVVGQMHAAGAGVTLTAADRAFLVEASFVPGDNRQAIKRFHRIGQHKAVRVDFVSATGTLDVAINSIIERKTRHLANLIRPS